MKLSVFFAALLHYMSLIPAAAVCFYPMRDHMRYDRRSVVLRSLLLFALTLPTAALISTLFGVSFRMMMLVLLPLYFALYQRDLQVHISKSLAVFSFVSALMSVMSNLLIAIDVLLQPHSHPSDFTLVSGAVRLALYSVAALTMLVPLRDYGSEMISELALSNVWFATVPISLLYIAFSVVIQPSDYEALRAGNLYVIFVLSVVITLSMMMLLMVMYYFIVKFILVYVRTDQRNRILEMQERQYVTQRRYIEESARARHDFKQTIAALKALADASDYEALDEYLDQYVNSLPRNEIVNYCRNNAVNALLNYYAQQAEQAGIALDIRIDMPENLPVSDVDLCGMMGNILENAVAACLTVAEGKRWIQFTAVTRFDSQLCIVATNSFDGNVRKKSGRYLSTHHSGRGIGLLSIASTAEKYGGAADFSHSGNEFYTDVMLPIA